MPMKCACFFFMTEKGQRIYKKERKMEKRREKNNNGGKIEKRKVENDAIYSNFKPFGIQASSPL